MSHARSLEVAGCIRRRGEVPWGFGRRSPSPIAARRWRVSRRSISERSRPAVLATLQQAPSRNRRREARIPASLLVAQSISLGHGGPAVAVDMGVAALPPKRKRLAVALSLALPMQTRVLGFPSNRSDSGPRRAFPDDGCSSGRSSGPLTPRIAEMGTTPLLSTAPAPTLT
jgi:hypothetical protein